MARTQTLGQVAHDYATLESILEAKKGTLSVTAANVLLKIGLPDEFLAQFIKLSRHIDDGSITEIDIEDYNTFLVVRAFIELLHAKAEASFKNGPESWSIIGRPIPDSGG